MGNRDPLALAGDPDSAALARQYLRVLGPHWDEHVRDAMLLLASEVVTNALRYGRPPLLLRLYEDVDLLLLCLTDNSTVPLTQLTGDLPMPSVAAEGGRGLPLLDLLARRWGSHLLIDRKGLTRHVLWFSVSRR